MKERFVEYRFKYIKYRFILDKKVYILFLVYDKFCVLNCIVDGFNFYIE